MARPGGNPGNKGGGRKSAYQEKADANELYKMFFEKIDEKKIRDKIATGKYSLQDVFLSKAFTGNERMLITLFQKIYPDLKEHRGSISVEDIMLKIIDERRNTKKEDKGNV